MAATTTTTSLNGAAVLPSPKQQKLKSPTNILDRDVAQDEVKHFLNAGGLKMLLGGIAVYLVVVAIIKLLG